MATLNVSASSSYLKVSAAARMYGVSGQTIRNEIERGNLVCIRTSGGHRRVTLASLREFYEGITVDDCAEEDGSGVVVYCRVSSEKQNQRGSLERQIARLLAEVTLREKVNPDSVKVYKEVCSSYSNRPILNSLVSAIIGGKVKKLYCECEDRLSRISSTTALIYHLCKQFGVVVVCLDLEEKDENELEAGMRELLAHAAIITARGNAAKSTIVTRKDVTGEVVSRMIQLRQKGHCVKDIYKQLKAEGFKTSHGDYISYHKVLKIIDSNRGEGLLTKIICGDGVKVDETCREFVEKRIVKSEGGQITMETIYPKYVQFCELNGKVAKPRNQLGRVLVKILSKPTKRVTGRNYWVGFSVS